MAISFPAPEAAQKQLGRAAVELQGASLIGRVGHVLGRGYERVCSAIFDTYDDCMRF